MIELADLHAGYLKAPLPSQKILHGFDAPGRVIGHRHVTTGHGELRRLLGSDVIEKSDGGALPGFEEEMDEVRMPLLGSAPTLRGYGVDQRQSSLSR